MRSNIQITQVNDFASFEKLRRGWDLLVESTPTQDVFLTWEWFYAWFKSYGKNTQPRIITAWEEDELVGVAPFMLIEQKKYGMTFRVLRTLSAPQCDVGGFLIKNGNQDILTGIIKHLVAEKGQWDVLEFNQFFLDAIETRAIVQGFSSNGFSSHQTINRHYYISYENRDWDTYLSALSRKFRKQLKRSQRKIDEAGGYAVQRFTGREVSWDVIQTVIDINSHSTYPTIYESEDDQTLHKELIDIMAERGWFDIFLFFLNDKPIAYEYGFLYRGRMESWRAGFDRRTDQNLSVGFFLTMNALKTGFEEKQKEMDFLRGDEGYKNSWRPDFREYAHLKATRSTNILAALAFIWLPKLKFIFQGWRQKLDQSESDESDE